MKTYALFLTIVLFASSYSFAEIKNGYEADIAGARASLRSLRALLNEDTLSGMINRKFINGQIKNIEAFITHYELTNRLLAEFNDISPAVYQEIRSIKDRHGRAVDVYVKVVDKNQLPQPLKGFTNVQQDKNDVDAYYSEYGFNTVSVKIANVKGTSILLAHEFGHISYLVPNLSGYVENYINYYKRKTIDANAMGHQPSDPSGHMARVYEGRFAVSYYARLKKNNAK